MSKAVAFTVRIPADLMRLVRELSAQRDRTPSYIIIKAIQFYFDNGYPIKQGAKAPKSTLE